MVKLLQKNKDKIKAYIPFVILALIMILIHIKINVNFGDDLAFSKVLEDKTLIQFIGERYTGWSSRIIIEVVMVSVLQLNVIVWKIIDVAMVVLLACSLSKIFNQKNKLSYNVIIVALVLIYPFIEMSSAGWVATTCNYLWPLAVGVFSLCGIIKIYNNSKMSKISMGVYIVATVYACNVEQMVVILLPTYVLACLVYYLKHKKISKFIMIQSIVAAVSLIFVATAPGNSVRKIAEIANWYPNYNGVSFLDKVTIGITSTVAEITLSNNYIFGLLLILLSIAIYLKRKDKIYTIISLVPIVIYIIMRLARVSNSGILKFVASKYYKNILNIYDFNSINAYNYDKISSYIPIILSIFMIGLIYILLYILFGNDKKTLLTMYIWSVGLASRVAMGFSPTMYASNTRTYIFLYFSIISIIILVSKEIGNNLSRKKIEMMAYISLMVSALYSISFFL